jgi:hypothetical protein
MKILPLTPAQAAFVEVELIGRYLDDEDERTAAVMETVSEHFGLTAATGTPGLAVPDAELLRRLVLDAMNGIDDAIDKGRSEQEGYGDARAARGLHKAASTLYQKLKGAGFGSMESSERSAVRDDDRPDSEHIERLHSDFDWMHPKKAGFYERVARNIGAGNASEAIDQRNASDYRFSEIGAETPLERALGSYSQNVLDTLGTYGLRAYTREAFEAFDAQVRKELKALKIPVPEAYLTLKQERAARHKRGLGDARDDCAAKLTALTHGDPVRIGGKAWVVWRLASDRGEHRSVTVFVIRAGSKGTKLYKLVVKELERCVVDVCLVNGMGEVIQGPVASGPLP